MLVAARDEDQGDALRLLAVARGRAELLLAGSFRTLTAGTAVAFWTAGLHRVLERSDDAAIATVDLPLLATRAHLDAGTFDRLARGEAIAGGPDWLATRAASWADELASPQAARDAVGLEVLASLRRLVATPLAAAAPPKGQQALAQAMTRWLVEHHRGEVAVRDVAAAVGIHPNYAMTLYRHETGITIGQAVARLRLLEARRLLATTDASITDVAVAAGFGSIARFYACFSEACALSPGQFRRRALRWARLRPDEARARCFESVHGGWIR